MQLYIEMKIKIKNNNNNSINYLPDLLEKINHNKMKI
jgi:hypothetical protein